MFLLVVCAIAVALLAYRFLCAIGDDGALARPAPLTFAGRLRRLVSLGAVALPMIALWLIPISIAAMYAYLLLQP